MNKVSIRRGYRLIFLVFGILVIGASAVVALTNPASNASAQTETSACSANGSVADDSAGGVTFTVSTSGNCVKAPLELVGVSTSGIKSVLSTKDLSTTSEGTLSASVSFYTSKAFAYYQIVIPNVFSANVQGS